MHAISAVFRRLRRSALLRPRAFDIVVFGDEFSDWVKILAPGAPVWQGVAGVRSVSHAGDDWRPPRLCWPASRRRLVLPLREINTTATPAGCWGLAADEKAIRTFADKRRFATYVRQQGLSHLAPEDYGSVERANFPCVLKLTDRWGGNGVAVAVTRDDLEAKRNSPPWAGRPVVIQGFVDGPEYAAHGICVRGRIVWHRAYAHETRTDRPIRVPSQEETTRPVALSAADLADMERFLLPLHYDGPVNFDYKRGLSGAISVLEINPRLGGSLFRSRNAGDLRAALAAIIAHARWREP